MHMPIANRARKGIIQQLQLSQLLIVQYVLQHAQDVLVQFLQQIVLLANLHSIWMDLADVQVLALPIWLHNKVLRVANLVIPLV